MRPRSATCPNSSSWPSNAPENKLEPMALASLRLLGASYSMSHENGPRASDPDMVFAARDHSPWSR